MADKIKWDEMGPYCEICGAHMGELYNEKTGESSNPHNYEDYGDNTCPKCGQNYTYSEGDAIVLSEEQRSIIQKHAGL